MKIDEQRIRATERAKYTALVAEAQRFLEVEAAAYERNREMRAKMTFNPPLGPCTQCGERAVGTNSDLSGNWQSPARSTPACEEHLADWVKRPFVSVSLTNLRAALAALESE